MKIEVRLGKLLKEEKHTYYWLSKETGISHTTLWRLKKGKALGVNFRTLEKLCEALQCQPGDILALKTKNKESISSPGGDETGLAAE